MRSLLARWYGPYGQATVWKQSAHLLADLPVGIGLFTAVVTLLSLSLGLMVTLVGFPLLMLTVLAGRWMGALERGRVHLLLDADLPGPSPLDASGGLVARTKRAMGDTAGWKGLAYGALMLPWGIITFTLAVVLWTVTFTFATLPLWGSAGEPRRVGGERGERAAPHRARPARRRAAAAGQPGDEPRHRQGPPGGEPTTRARRAGGSWAHDEAKQAIAELRDLVRGIHPAVLTDRGLDAAVSALGRPLPRARRAASDLPGAGCRRRRGTAYFVVAEALTNVAKHSGARRRRACACKWLAIA
jgi:hypothetical protein